MLSEKSFRPPENQEDNLVPTLTKDIFAQPKKHTPHEYLKWLVPCRNQKAYFLYCSDIGGCTQQRRNWLLNTKLHCKHDHISIVLLYEAEKNLAITTLEYQTRLWTDPYHFFLRCFVEKSPICLCLPLSNYPINNIISYQYHLTYETTKNSISNIGQKSHSHDFDFQENGHK